MAELQVAFIFILCRYVFLQMIENLASQIREVLFYAFASIFFCCFRLRNYWCRGMLLLFYVHKDCSVLLVLCRWASPSAPGANFTHKPTPTNLLCIPRLIREARSNCANVKLSADSQLMRQ